MSRQSMTKRPFYDWDNWFISVKNKDTGIMHYVEKNDEFTSTFFNDYKEQYSIYLTKLINNIDLYQSSALIGFNEDNMTVKTKNGSVYNLKTPINDNQLTNLKNYFNR